MSPRAWRSVALLYAFPAAVFVVAFGIGARSPVDYALGMVVIVIVLAAWWWVEDGER